MEGQVEQVYHVADGDKSEAQGTSQGGGTGDKNGLPAAPDMADIPDHNQPGMEETVHVYTDGFIPDTEISTAQRFRTTWPEKRILALLDIYINEHPAYLRAKAERQITEFHEYIGQIVSTEGTLVAGLLKNLSREYRKIKGRAVSEDARKLRGSQLLWHKFDYYYSLYNKGGISDGSDYGNTLNLNLSSSSDTGTPKIKKVKKMKTAAEPRVDPAMLLPPQLKMPPVPVMSDKYCQEYIQVMREQNRALVEIGKELRLMRMGYFTEHELAMDA